MAGALMGPGAPGGGGGRALASCSRRTWCCSCWIFRGSLGRERKATPSERELEGTSVGGSEVKSWTRQTTSASSTLRPLNEAQATGLSVFVACR
ncbi:hypothetical protein PAL_GLEAN10016678 [Pteropus alecto]|uniref:Uncharacterized protein n=1 Tax=Pteropus alecto TaxID=9402 RepID=L5L1R1_PTEAL|nr:hypothetical protein PAL_GLEAN10016678 [Pteropus alecto]